MSARAIVPGALILAVLGGTTVRAADPPLVRPLLASAQEPAAQQPPPATPMPEVLPNPQTTPPVGEPLGPAGLPPTPGGLPVGPNGLPPGSYVDPWVNYSRPGCCGPVGANGPIGWDIYARNGLAAPVATGILHTALQPGWMTELGARTLFFNRDTDAAWVVDYGLSYTLQNGNRSDVTLGVPFNFPVQNPVTLATEPQSAPVLSTIRDYQRASFNASLGREWYLFKPAYSPGWHYRLGFDVGGRWIASRLDLNDIANLPTIIYRHKYDVAGALFTALHSDVEIPAGPCSWFVLGFRVEWNYNWSDILAGSTPPTKSDLQDVNFLFTTGFRF